MTNKEDEHIRNWLNEEFPLDNNMQTNEELSDDENIECELSSNDFIFPYADEVARSIEKNYFDDYAVILDENIQLYLATMEIQELVVICIPATSVPGSSSNSIIPPVKQI